MSRGYKISVWVSVAVIAAYLLSGCFRTVKVDAEVEVTEVEESNVVVE